MVMTLGVGRDEMAKEHKVQLQNIINLNTKKDTYFILVHSMNNAFTGNVHDRYILTSIQPARMLGTILYFVDNRKGLLKRIWCLPLDRTNVIPEAILDKEHTIPLSELTDERIIE